MPDPPDGDRTPRRRRPPTSSPDDLGGYIRHRRLSAGLSLRQLARRAGVSNPYLSQIERGRRRPSAEILQAIAGALGLRSETLFVKAGLLPHDRPEIDVEVAIARDPRLTDRHRDALVEIYRSLCRLAELERGADGTS